nr:DUF4157 domain-containing protein [Pseudenhygromyxa sp. WMMC2535]
MARAPLVQKPPTPRARTVQTSASTLRANSQGQRLSPSVKAQVTGPTAAPAQEVIVHDDGFSDHTCARLNTAAFTVSNHVFMSRSSADLSQPQNLRTLAHEVAHVGQQTRGDVAPRIQRANSKYTTIAPVEAPEAYDSKPSNPALESSPSDAYKLQRVQDRNYTDRENGLKDSIKLYFDRLTSEWEEQGFFNPDYHEGLKESYRDLLKNSTDRLTHHCMAAEAYDMAIMQKLFALDGLINSEYMLELQKDYKSQTKKVNDLMTKRGRLRGLGNQSLVSAQTWVEKTYPSLARAAKKKGNLENETNYERLRKEKAVKVAAATDELKNSDQYKKLHETEAILNDVISPYFNDMVTLNKLYETELTAIDEAKAAATEVGFTFLPTNKPRQWRTKGMSKPLKATIRNHDLEQVIASAIIPYCPVIEFAPDPDRKATSEDIRKLYLKLMVARKLDTMSVDEMTTFIEEVAVADPQLMQDFVVLSVLEFAGTEWGSAHGSWLDPRGLVKLLVADTLLFELSRKSKLKTNEAKYFKNLKDTKMVTHYPGSVGGNPGKVLAAISEMQPGAALTYLVELRRTSGPGETADYPDFAWVQTVLNTQLFLQDSYYNDVASKYNKYLTADSKGRLVYDYASDNRISGNKAGRWRRHMQEWMQRGAVSWRKMAVGTVTSEDDKITAENPVREPNFMLNEAVCNEIAELTQAKCGRVQPGGLSGNAKQFALARGGLHVVSDPSAQLVPCAALFWLDWSKRKPNPENRVDYRAYFELTTEEKTPFVFEKKPDAPKESDEDKKGEENGADKPSSPKFATFVESPYTYKVPNACADGSASGQCPISRTGPDGLQHLWWKHEATVAFPPYRGQLITFEPENPDHTEGALNVAQLRKRPLSKLEKQWDVRVGSDAHSKSGTILPSRAPWELLDRKGSGGGGFRDVGNTDSSWGTFLGVPKREAPAAKKAETKPSLPTLDDIIAKVFG